MTSIENVDLGVNDVAVKATVEVQTDNGIFTLNPLFIIKDQMVGRVPDESPEIGVKLVFNNVIPDQNIFEFSAQTTQQDWMVFKVIEKPYINLLWIGTIMLLIGLLMAMFRRYRDFKLMRDKGQD